MKVSPQDAAGLTIGIELVASIVLVSAIGYWSDRRFGTYPWLTIAGFLLGATAGFRSLFRLAGKLDKAERDQTDTTDTGNPQRTTPTPDEAPPGSPKDHTRP